MNDLIYLVPTIGACVVGISIIWGSEISNWILFHVLHKVRPLLYERQIVLARKKNFFDIEVMCSGGHFVHINNINFTKIDGTPKFEVISFYSKEDALSSIPNK